MAQGITQRVDKATTMRSAKKNIVLNDKLVGEAILGGRTDIWKVAVATKMTQAIIRLGLVKGRDLPLGMALQTGVRIFNLSNINK